MAMAIAHELWIFNHYAGAPDQPTGTRHFELARGLARQGFRVTIFAAGVSHFTRVETRVHRARLYETRVVEGVRFVWVRTVPYRGNSWLRLLNMLTYAVVVLVAQSRRPRPDVVIGSTVHPFAAAAACVAARVRGARFLYEIRDLWPQTLVDMGALRSGSFTARLLWWIEAALVRRAETVITLLPGMADYLARRGLPTDRILHLPNGVRIEAGAAAEAPPPVLNAIDGLRAGQRFICGYLGAHGRTNGLRVVLGAAAELQRQGQTGIHFVLIGDGPEKHGLISSARAQGLGNVTFLDPVRKVEVPATLRQLDAAILHLTHVDVFRYGISPNKLFDYMAAGLPVVFACRSWNDPVRDAGAGLSLVPDDPVALAEAIATMAALPVAKRRELGAAGRRYVEAHHDLARLALRLGDHLRDGHETQSDVR